MKRGVKKEYVMIGRSTRVYHELRGRALKGKRVPVPCQEIMSHFTVMLAPKASPAHLRRDI